jgi:hypothetical protein
MTSAPRESDGPRRADPVDLEARFLANTELVESVRRSMAHPEQLLEIDWRADTR